MLKTFDDLIIWQKSYQLCLDIYRSTRNFLAEDKFELVAQMRSSAVSMPTKIAEGYGRKTTPEFIYLYHVTYGSLSEPETQ